MPRQSPAPAQDHFCRLLAALAWDFCGATYLTKISPGLSWVGRRTCGLLQKRMRCLLQYFSLSALKRIWVCNFYECGTFWWFVPSVWERYADTLDSMCLWGATLIYAGQMEWRNQELVLFWGSVILNLINWISSVYIYTHTRIHTYMIIYVYIYMYVYMYIYIYISPSLHTYVCIYIYISTYLGQS